MNSEFKDIISTKFKELKDIIATKLDELKDIMTTSTKLDVFESSNSTKLDAFENSNSTKSDELKDTQLDGFENSNSTKSDELKDTQLDGLEEFNIELFYRKLEDFQEIQITIGKLIGKGGYGEIYDIQYNGKTYIIKLINIDDFLGIKDSVSQLSEIDFMKKIKNEIILLFFLSKKKVIPKFILCLFLSKSNKIGIISEKYDCDLLKFIKSNIKLLNTNNNLKKNIENQLIKLYDQLLKYNIICTDIKLNNILIKYNGTICEIRLNDIDTQLCSISDLFDILSSTHIDKVDKVDKDYIHILYGMQLFIESAKYIKCPLYYNIFIGLDEDIAIISKTRIISKLKDEYIELYPIISLTEKNYELLKILEFTKKIFSIKNTIMIYLYKNIIIHLQEYNFYKNRKNPYKLEIEIYIILDNIHILNLLIMNILTFIFNYTIIIDNHNSSSKNPVASVSGVAGVSGVSGLAVVDDYSSTM
jgi:hypothetical protein